MLRRFFSASANNSNSSVAILLDWQRKKLNESWKNLLTAAKKLQSNDITAILPIPRSELGNFNKQSISGVKRVILVPIETPHRAAEEVCTAVKEALKHFKLQHLLAVHDSFGKNCVPRLAASIPNAVSLSDVLSIESNFTFTRSIYAGNAIAKLATSASNPHCITIRASAFAKSDANDSVAEVSESPSSIVPDFASKLVKTEVAASERPELSSAKVVVSGGRAMKSAENFSKLIYPLADALNAAVGASRAAVDAGFVSNDLQVGQTGKIVAPDLYIAIGISGAIQHVAGMKDSKVIVAINKDADCPIFQVADYGLVGDLFTIVPELTAKLRKQ